MELNTLKYKHGSRGHKVKTAGRGFGAGSARGFKGNKGQGQRKTVNVRPGFEGGQTPLYMRTAKIGFNNKAFGTKYNVINLAQIVQLGETNVDTNVLFDYRIVRNNKLPLKIIGTADLKLTKKYSITCNKISAGAKTAIEEAGGTVTIL